VALAWGTTFVMTQGVVATMPVSSFLLWRFAIATLALVALRPRAVMHLTRRDRRRGFVVGLAMSAGFALQSLGLQHTSASTSGFVTGLFVALTPVMSGLLFREPIPRRVLGGVALATVGLAALSIHGLAVGAGEAITLLGAVAFATQIALLGRYSTTGNALGLTTIQLGVVSLVGLALAPLEGGLQLPSSAGTWAQLAFLGIVASALAFTVLTWSQSHLSSTRAAVIMTGEPLWAAVAGVLIAADPVTPRLLTGGILILAAMLIVEAGPLRAPRLLFSQ
jgi:drug/metabolite transporter (DMT)-like permease